MLTPFARRVMSRTRLLKRSKAFGAMTQHDDKCNCPDENKPLGCPKFLLTADHETELRQRA
jgi:hypothetical protein